MTLDRSDAMHRARRLDGEHKRALVLAAADAAIERGIRPTVAGIARAAGVGRKFIYDHADLRADIELKVARTATRQASDMVSTARVTSASLRAELENSRAQVERLTNRLRAVERRLSEAEGARLVADDLLPASVVAELADRQLAQRVEDLAQQLFEANDALLRTTEELEAARTVNRELMQRLNVSSSTSSPVPISHGSR